MPWMLIALVGVLFLATIFLAPKPQVENARASTLDDLNFPVTKEGTPIPWIIGKVRQKGPNVIWYGDFKAVPIKKKVKTGLFSSKKVIIGYKYYIGMDMGLAMGGPVTLHQIWCDKDSIWTGTANSDTGSAVSINLPELFGGTSDTAGGGGGLVGTFRFYPGTFTQSVNAYMASKVPGGVYNRVTGQAHIVAEQIYFGTSPNLRPFSFEISRYPNALALAGGKEKIGEDSNPAEALYQILLTKWGALGIDPNDIDATTFVTCGNTLFTEGNGISLLVSKANSAKSVIEEVLRQIDGIMYQDPTTGKIIMSLIRNDYNILTLPVLDPSNIVSLRNFSRTSWDDTLNQARVGFTNRSNKYETGMAMQQDMANINSQGRVRSANFTFPGCTTATLAQYLCSRELARMSVPLFKGTIEVNRTVSNLRPGQPFILNWPEYGLDQVVMRAQRFSLGELLDGRCVVEALQDIFAVSKTIFSTPPGTGWVPQNTSPVAPLAGVLWEAPYWIVKQNQEIINTPSTTSRGWVVAMARQADANQVDWIYDVTQSGDTLEAESLIPWTNTAVLQTPIAVIDGFATGKIGSITVNTVLPDTTFLTSATTTEITNTGKNLFVMNGEVFAYESFTNAGGGNYTLNNVWRAVLDTQPLVHAVGSTVFFLSVDGFVESEFSSVTAISGNFYSHTTKGLSTAFATSMTPNRRYERPTPPGNVTVNGAARSNSHGILAGNPITVSWVARNRITDTTPFRTLADATVIGAEAGTTYNLRWYLNGTLKATLPNVTSGGTATFTPASTDAGTVKIEVDAVVGGLASFNPAVYYLTTTAPVVFVDGAARYWRFRSDDTAIAGEYMGIAEFELKTVAAGADVITGAETFTASATAGGFPPSQAADNNNATIWTTGANVPPAGGHWWMIDFGAGNDKDIIEATVRVRNDGFREDPLNLYVEKSNDGVNWGCVFGKKAMAAWTAGEQRTFSRPANAVRSTNQFAPAGAVASQVVTWPAGAVAGDRVVIFASSAWAVNTPAGWTTIIQEDGSNINGEVMTRVLDAADITAGSVTVTFAGSWTIYVAAVCCIGAPTVVSSVQQRFLTTGSPLTLTGCLGGDTLLWYDGIRGASVLPVLSRATTAQSNNVEARGILKTERLIGEGGVSCVFTHDGNPYSAGVCLRY